MTDTKLPEWPVHALTDHEWCDYDIGIAKWWESRARLLYAAMKEVERLFDNEDTEILDFLNIAEEALKACGPLPEEQKP